MTDQPIPAVPRYVPVTPAGTFCMWLVSTSEQQAWEKLLQDAAHMPYKTKQGFLQRGYRVEMLLCEEGEDDDG